MFGVGLEHSNGQNGILGADQRCTREECSEWGVGRGWIFYLLLCFGPCAPMAPMIPQLADIAHCTCCNHKESIRATINRDSKSELEMIQSIEWNHRVHFGWKNFSVHCLDFIGHFMFQVARWEGCWFGIGYLKTWQQSSTSNLHVFSANKGRIASD